MNFSIPPKYQNIIFYCTTLVYFWFVGGAFRFWFPGLEINSRFGVSIAVVILVGLIYWFFEKIVPQVTGGRKELLLGYWLGFWFTIFFVSRYELALFWPLVWLAFLLWQIKIKVHC